MFAPLIKTATQPAKVNPNSVINLPPSMQPAIHTIPIKSIVSAEHTMGTITDGSCGFVFKINGSIATAIDAIYKRIAITLKNGISIILYNEDAVEKP